MNSNNLTFAPPKGYDIVKYGNPKQIIEGSCAGQFRNMYWKVKDNNDDTYYMMHIIDNIYTKISKRDINKILEFKNIRPTWRLFQNGYIVCTINNKEKQKVYYLHQLIMDVHDKDNSDFEETVDHINRDKLDNRQSNLRLVNMSVQNSNRDKPERRIDACDLPNGIVQTDLPKYVVYRNERYKLSNDNDQEDYNYRDYFYICNHPKLEKRWETTKSMNVSIHEKLKQAKLKLQELEGDITTKQYNKQSGLDKIIDLPIGIRLIEQRDKKQLVFDLRKDNDVVHVRYNIKMVLKSTNLQTELNRFIDMINIKYPELKMDKYIIKNIPKIKESEISTNPIVKYDDVAALPLSLPSNITLYNEKDKYYFEFNKSVDKVRKNVKYTLKSNDIQSELNKFIENVNTKYPELKIPNYTIQHIPDKYNNIIKQHEVIQNDTKPDMPNNFSICCVNGTDYIQFCKKIDNKKHQYKTRINSYDLQSELNRFVDYLNETYKFATVLIKDSVITNGWRTTNNIICHDNTPEKLASRARANNYNIKKREEMGEEKYKEMLRNRPFRYRAKKEINLW
jgi:starvation-inducible outer membrane lipoprotein